MILFDPERHEALGDAPWDEQVARDGIREIVADAESAYDATTLWPKHELDDPTPGPWTSVYIGASGIAWALMQLGATRDWRAEAKRFVDIYLEAPETGTVIPSLMLGEVGVRAVADLEDPRLYELIGSNIENDTLEMLWGAPGTMLPALFLFERTGEPRWRDLYLRNVEHLLRTWEHRGVWMWTQKLYGEHVRQLGAAHGFAGNVYALLRGSALLTDEQRATVIERAVDTLTSTALRDGELTNWMPHVGAPRQGREKILLQWCHGAPGMITSLYRLPPDDEVDALFAGGAELTWRAGPLAKGSGLCHGTAGNGYAFIAMHARTRDPKWMERARRFAMHALARVRSARATYGRGRYSLWTGDLGVALYLQHCLDGAGELPILSRV